jgi:predicted DNA binding CopG/RHH family protein
MPNYVKNEKGYEKIAFNAKAIREAYRKSKTAKKHPTSVNLPENVIAELKAMALKMGIPYQTIMRKLIVEGLEELKKAA